MTRSPLMDAEGLQTRLDDFTIVQSMFPMGEELKIFHSYENIEQVKSAFNERPHDPTLEAVVYFSLDDDTDPKSAAPGHATMKLVVPLVIGSKPTATLIDVQPLISRKDYDLLARLVVNQSAATTAAVPLTELLLEAMDLVRTSYQLFQGSNSQRLAEESARKFAEQTQTALGEGDDWRVWFFFPSLSTKEKRNDLVMYARERKMTGFVLAGKPGLLCVEGPIDVIDEYMAAIKSQSWSDIPSYQKKVSERHREPLVDCKRAFDSMEEITDLISVRGQYNHRGDMKEVRDYLTSKGVAEVFGIVIGMGA